jgi:His-Xaa-Ser system protein HxsD
MPTKNSRRAPARPAKPSRRAAPATGEVVVSVKPGADGPEPVLGAAYLMMDRAYALVEPAASGALRVTLRPKGARGSAELKALESAFQDELAAQRLRWAVARNNISVREYVAENALSLAEEFASRPAAAPEPANEQLTADQRAEIERLIAEVETEISDMNRDQKLPDPKGATRSWEAAQEEAGRKGEARE